jgi:hypothetical protein
MRHRLAGRFTVIDPNIEALNRAVLVCDVRFHLVQQSEDCVSFPARNGARLWLFAYWKRGGTNIK